MIDSYISKQKRGKTMSKKLQIFQMYEDRVESSFYPEEQITEDELSVRGGSRQGLYLKSEMGRLKNDGLYGDWVYVVFFDEKDRTEDAMKLFLERLEVRENRLKQEYNDSLADIERVRAIIKDLSNS